MIMSNVSLCDYIFNMKEIMKELLIIYKKKEYICIEMTFVNIRKYI